MRATRVAGIGTAMITAAAGLIVPGVALSIADARPRTRNAIFNGTFAEGVMGYGVLGPGHKAAVLSVDKSQHAQTLVTDLIVSSPGMERPFTLYSTYLLLVRPGREYPMSLQAAGNGRLVFGAFEYDERGGHLGNNYSQRCVLSPKFQQFSFTYKPSKNATGIRPSIVFLEPTEGSRLDLRVRLRSFEMPVPADQFSETCKSWPDYAKDDAFAAYNGFSAAELAQLRDLAHAGGVLPPYQPIAMTSPGDFTLTMSRVRFGTSVLPQRIAVLGREILAGPMTLAVGYSDGTRLDLSAGQATVVHGGEKSALSQQVRAANKAFTVGLNLHYDALLVYSLTLPAAPETVVDNVSLAIPLRADVARYLHYDKPSLPGKTGTGGWVFGYGPIPQPGEKVETKATVGSVRMGEAKANDWKPEIPGAEGLLWEWNRGFPPMLWIGDEARGLSMVCPSTQGYAARKGDPTLRLVRSREGVTLMCRLVSSQVRLDKARRLQFALQIMPPKPIRADGFFGRYNTLFPGSQEDVDKGLAILERQVKPSAPASKAQGEVPSYTNIYRVLRTGLSPGIWEPREHRRYRDIGFLWYTLWSRGARGAGLPVGGCCTPLVGHPQRLSRLVRCSDLVGHLGLPYFAATHIATEDPAGWYYVEKTDEWTQHPRVARPPYLRPTCPNSLFAAYVARGIGKLIDDHGIAGVYFDNCAPQLCQNTGHGCGYVDDQGILQPTLPILGFRKLFMMVRREFVKRGTEPFLLTHAGLFPGAVSFTDAELQGEGTYGSDHTEMLTLGEWRARWLGANQFGVQLSYLPAFGYGLGPNVNRAEQEVIGTPRLLAMSLLHGTPVWAQYVDTQLVYRAWTVLDELDEPGTAFLPYWQWPTVNRAINAKHVYASAYLGKDRLLLVLSNLGATPREIALPLAEIQAQHRLLTRVTDNLHGLPVRHDGGVVKCTVESKNFRLLSFTK